MNDFQSRLPERLYAQIAADNTHRFPHRPGSPGLRRAKRGEVLIDRRWHIRLGESCGALTKLAADDLQRTLADVFNVRPARATHAIDVTITPGIAPDDESSEIDVAADAIRIRAAGDEAAMRALFDLRWRMLNRQAPVLPLGTTQLAPAWSMRIMSPVWHRAIDRPEDYVALPEAYLLNAARYGYNATYLFADWLDFMTPASAGTLARPGAAHRLAELRRAVAHLRRFGIRLLMHINTLAMPHDHPFFKADPARRGAQTWRDGMHCLCSSNPKIIELYRRAARQLMADVPGLAGAVLITGGECFLHCYTRPTPQTARGTNCPRCGRHAPEKVIAGIVNAFAAGACDANPNAHVMMWPYSAFAWGDDSAQQRLIQGLDKRVSLLTTFEKDQSWAVDGVKAAVFDYSISRLGPSPLFRKLHRTARQAGLKVYARTESAQCIEMFNVPRIPIMRRWADRFKAIRDIGVDGVHTAWRFYGFCAQRNDELVYAAAWHKNPDFDALLKTMASRDFGPRAAPGAVRAWRHFSEGFARFPFCAGVTGFPYFRGPFYIGPAHPFVFDLTMATDVPDMFWTPSPAAGEASSSKGKQPALPRHPRFFMDMVWTQPYGAERVAAELKAVERSWRKGLVALDGAMKLSAGRQHAALEDERAVATIIHCMLTTACNLITFQMLREQVISHPSTPAVLRRVCRQAMKVVAAEIDNARTALQLVRADPRLGYGATYGYAFTPAMIEAKIAQCQSQLDRAIPNFFYTHGFHCFNIPDRTLDQSD